MTEEWVSLWYQCLDGNEDYAAYCKAKQAGDDEKCAAYEAKFEHIADIHKDFGDPDGLFIDKGIDSQEWRDWFEPRRHLFMANIEPVQNLSTYQARDEHLLLDISLLADPELTADFVKNYLVDYYRSNPVITRPVPKYKLNLKESGSLAHSLVKVKLACLVATRNYCYHTKPGDDRYALDFQEEVTEFARHEIQHTKWHLYREDLTNLQTKGELDASRRKSFSTQLRRARKDYVAFARNVLRNRFPDDSPFDSNARGHWLDRRDC